MNLVELAGGLWVLDLDRRTYAALSHEGDYWHLIRPRRAEDAQAGAWREVGTLMCNCAGGQRHGRCYRLEEAEAFERQLEDAAWGLAPSPFAPTVPDEGHGPVSHTQPVATAGPQKRAAARRRAERATTPEEVPF